MQLKMIEVSLSKEERRIVDELGNTASTWARIGITAELEEGDLPERCIALLKGEIQPQVDDWLLNQGGLVIAPPEALPELEMEALEELFDGEAVVTQMDETAASPEAGEDEIPE